MSKRVAILGASNKPERYSYKALKMLQAKGHEVFLVSPAYREIEGNTVYKTVKELTAIDTLTVYVRPSISDDLKNEILKLKPNRVIFNPGSENNALAKSLEEFGIETEEACTLVLLTTEQF